MTTVAAPVFNESGAVTYCITGTMFAGQHSATTLRRIGEAVRDTTM